MSSIFSSCNLSSGKKQPAPSIRLNNSQLSTNNRMEGEKLFLCQTPYSCISQSLSEHIAQKSNGDILSQSLNGFSTAVNSLMNSENGQNYYSANPSAQDLAKPNLSSYAPSPATHFKNSDCSDDSGSLDCSGKSDREKTKKNLQLYHQEAFKFLLTLNSNLQKFKDSENRRKLRNELNLDQSSINCSRDMDISDISSSFTLISAATPEVYLNESKIVQEKKNTIQTLFAATFCKSQMFNQKRYSAAARYTPK